MLSCASRRLFCGRHIVSATSSIVGCRLMSAVESVEYEIVENMKTYPLFTEKVQRVGSTETNLKYFKGSEWMKSCDKLKFNLDSTSLAELVPGSMDTNNNYKVEGDIKEETLSDCDKTFDEMKTNIDSFLSKQPSLFVQDGKLGTSERSCVHIRSVTNDPLVSLVLQSLTFPVLDVKSKEGNEYRNNMTIYFAKNNNASEQGISGKLVGNHNYQLIVNGNCSMSQLIDRIAAGAMTLYHTNNKDLADLTTGESSAKDAINTVVLPCSCIRAKNNVSSFIFNNDFDMNVISHEHLDEVHRNSFNTGSLYSLDYTVITNNGVNCLFGGVQLNNSIGTLVPPTNSIFLNNNVYTAIQNDSKCTIPSSVLFIQNATGMSELSYQDYKKLIKTWTQPEDMSDYLLAWTRVHKVECFKISYTIMKDLIAEMETIEYNRKEKLIVCSKLQTRNKYGNNTKTYSSCFPNDTTIMVVSSTTFSSSNHLFHATVESRSTASYG